MYVAPVEIYSDATNEAVMRHPGRRFPGIVIQDDTLYTLCRDADRLCALSRASLAPDDFAELNDLRNSLRGFLQHYKKVLAEHDMELPFNEEEHPLL